MFVQQGKRVGADIFEAIVERQVKTGTLYWLSAGKHIDKSIAINESPDVLQRLYDVLKILNLVIKNVVAIKSTKEASRRTLKQAATDIESFVPQHSASLVLESLCWMDSLPPARGVCCFYVAIHSGLCFMSSQLATTNNQRQS